MNAVITGTMCACVGVVCGAREARRRAFQRRVLGSHVLVAAAGRRRLAVCFVAWGRDCGIRC
jgi:hypothetical protein